MALMEADSFDPPLEWRPQDEGDEVIDRAHLTRMTFGDRGLQQEVLQLFIRQSAMLVGRMDPARPAVVSALSHTLAGSAAGLGAKRLARMAASAEAASRTAPHALADELAALREALEDTSAAIRGILRAP